MRLRMSKKTDKEYMCCCCHVRTGTIILGCLQLIASLLVVFFMTVTFLYPDLLPKTKTDISKWQANNEVATSTAAVTTMEDGLTDYQNIYDSWNWVNDSDSTYENQCFGLFVTFLALIATLMLVYGAVKGIASFLMPYFVLQVFDFALSCLTILGYFSTVIDVKEFIKELAKKVDIPETVKDSLLSIDGHWLTLILAACVVSYLLFKAYLINIVWSCYKYLTCVQASTRVVQGVTQYMESDDAQLLLPPKYEEVANSEQLAPPPYSAA